MGVAGQVTPQGPRSRAPARLLRTPTGASPVFLNRGRASCAQAIHGQFTTVPTCGVCPLVGRSETSAAGARRTGAGAGADSTAAHARCGGGAAAEAARRSAAGGGSRSGPGPRDDPREEPRDDAPPPVPPCHSINFAISSHISLQTPPLFPGTKVLPGAMYQIQKDDTGQLKGDHSNGLLSAA